MPELLVNPRRDRAGPFPSHLAGGFADREMARARRWVEACPRHRVNAVLNLEDVARDLGLDALHLVDETRRFGLGSFKALGGAYAVLRQVASRLRLAGDPPRFGEDELRTHASSVTVACATDGNHGRSVAAGARLAGCRCVIFLHRNVSVEREEALSALGAEIRRVAGDYDDSVREASRAAVVEGWILVADTSDDEADPVPAQVMSGYGVLVDEALAQLPRPPTHVFVQAGVGGLAGAVLSRIWQLFGAERPQLVVVEPEGADCVLASARRGRAAPLGRPMRTELAMLECGEPSATAWPLLDIGADAFLSIADADAFGAVRLLARRDPPLAVGESGAAGLGGAIVAAREPDMRARLGLNADAHVLAVATEGATDVAMWRRIVHGEAHDGR